VAPRGTPKPIIDKINREVVGILADASVRRTFDQSGNFAVSSTPEEFEAFIRREANRWSKVLADLAIKYD
jgi:tripartite-type tricarboxylate transporter receptor subunit TctC